MLSKYSRVVAFAIGIVPTVLLVNAALALDPPKCPLGTWTIVKLAHTGKPVPEVEGGTFTLEEGGAGGFKLNQFQRQKGGVRLLKAHDEKVTFVINAENSNAEFFQFEIANREDERVHGGGGPRKGIGRYNKDGSLEIIENTSANEPYPIDFSDNSKSSAKHWLMKPTKAKPEAK